MFKDYYKTIQFLESLNNIPQKTNLKAKDSLDRFKYLLKTLGNPQNSLKFIHVGGTSGKGSVVSMIQSILTESGIKAGAYISPHPTTTIERIKVGKKYISPKDFSKLVNSIIPKILKTYLNNSWGRPSYIEIILATAFLYFKKTGCKYVVLEVGCGGRDDITNIIRNTKFSIVTNVDYDHTEILGKTLIQIARHKAGIIKPNSVFFTTETRPKILKLFKNYCKKNKAKFNSINQNIISKNPIINQLPSLSKHQKKNAILAISVAKKLNINDSKIIKGILNSHLPCRFEKMQEKPLVIIDGAHNPSKIKSLVNGLKNLTYKKLFLIIGITQSKDATKMLKYIIPLTNNVYLTRYQVSQKKCADFKKLSKIINNIKSNNNINTDIFLNPFDALDTALNNASQNDLIVITGSFFLAGELRKKWVSEEKILKTKESF